MCSLAQRVMMVRSKQAEGPRIAELEDLDQSAGRDLAWIVAVCVVLATTAVAYDAFGRFQRASDGLGDRNLNGVVALAVLIPIASTMYAMRRYREGMQAQRTLARLTVHDGLTGLPNRRFLGDSFRCMLNDSRSDLGNLAVLFVDLDRFKSVNDTYGHEVGDHLMRAVAERLVASLREQDVVVRYAGDEFVLLILGVSNSGVAERVASRTIHALETPFELGSDRIQISASIGIALDGDRTATPDELLRDADAAMYQAKAHGPGAFALFDPTMRDRLTPATARRRMRSAIDNGEFSVTYKPVVSLWTGRIVTLEAQLRWDEPTRGVIRPDEFLPALDETGLIVPAGEWMIRQVCEQHRRWSEITPGRTPVGVLLPISVRQLSQSNFVDQISSSVLSAGIPAGSIVLKIDEHTLASDLGLLRHSLRAARDAGVRLALDDSATGMSSLGHLRHLDLDVLKVDASYVAGVLTDERDTTVVGHVIALARSLGIVTVASGVETAGHIERLRSLGCDLAEGSYFSSALSADAVGDLLVAPPTPAALFANADMPPAQPATQDARVQHLAGRESLFD